MRILIITPYFYPKIGGVEKHSFNIAKGLKEKDHEVLVITSNHMERKFVKHTVQGVKVIRLAHWFTVSNTPINPIWYFKLRKIVKAYKPDIIEAHAPVPGMADFAFAAKSGTKFVIKYHAGSMKKGKGVIDILISVYEKTILKHILKGADNIMAVYPDFIYELIGYDRNIEFIPPGVDTENFKPDKSVAKTNDILYVGRIEQASAWKGIDILLKAVALIAITHPTIKLKLVGSGDAIEYYKKLTSDLGIDRNVSFEGVLTGKALVNAYNASRILVLPSLSEAESFGNVLIEAMACEIPVIGSRIGGIPNVIRDEEDGLLVPPNEPESLAMAIIKILGNRDLAIRMGKNGRQRVKSQFSEKQLIDRTEKVLCETEQQ